MKRSVELIDAPDGDLILMRTSAEDVRVERPGEEGRELLGALDGEHSVAELEARFGREEVGRTFEGMEAFGLLEDAADDERLEPGLRERFDRQLRYFSDLGDPERTPSDCQRRLAGAEVAVLGVGGLGGRVALDLASVGVGRLRLADGDRVELSNLNRQIQFAEADVGLLKAERMAARLRAFNSTCEVEIAAERLEDEEQVAGFVSGADIVVDAADWPTHEIERWCNSACFEVGVPYITMSHFPPVARVGPLFVPGVTGCFACLETSLRREYPLYDVAVEQRRARPLPVATLGPACGIVAGLVAAEVMHFLTGLVVPPTLAAGHTLDLRTFELGSYEVVAESDCPVCAGPTSGVAG